MSWGSYEDWVHEYELSISDDLDYNPYADCKTVEEREARDREMACGYTPVSDKIRIGFDGGKYRIIDCITYKCDDDGNVIGRVGGDYDEHAEVVANTDDDVMSYINPRFFPETYFPKQSVPEVPEKKEMVEEIVDKIEKTKLDEVEEVIVPIVAPIANLESFVLQNSFVAPEPESTDHSVDSEEFDDWVDSSAPAFEQSLPEIVKNVCERLNFKMRLKFIVSLIEMPYQFSVRSMWDMFISVVGAFDPSFYPDDLGVIIAFSERIKTGCLCLMDSQFQDLKFLSNYDPAMRDDWLYKRQKFQTNFYELYLIKVIQYYDNGDAIPPDGYLGEDEQDLAEPDLTHYDDYASDDEFYEQNFDENGNYVGVDQGPFTDARDEGDPYRANLDEMELPDWYFDPLPEDEYVPLQVEIQQTTFPQEEDLVP